MPQRAFSLVELSIVLVILGLLVGGIVAGQSLIRAAELRKTMAEIERIKTGTHAFRDKYLGLPGDISNATSFWGAADGGTGTTLACNTATPNGTATCNGNGDGYIGTTTTNTGPESYRFWQQLVNAGLLDGDYTGIPTAPAYNWYYHDDIGKNIPRSSLNNRAGYSVSYWWSKQVGMSPQNVIALAPCCWSDGTNRANIEGSAVTPVDTWKLDTKWDDGLPGYGNFRIYAGYGGQLSATQYDLGNTAIMCMPIIGLEK